MSVFPDAPDFLPNQQQFGTTVININQAIVDTPGALPQVYVGDWRAITFTTSNSGPGVFMSVQFTWSDSPTMVPVVANETYITNGATLSDTIPALGAYLGVTVNTLTAGAATTLVLVVSTTNQSGRLGRNIAGGLICAGSTAALGAGATVTYPGTVVLPGRAQFCVNSITGSVTAFLQIRTTAATTQTIAVLSQPANVFGDSQIVSLPPFPVQIVVLNSAVAAQTVQASLYTEWAD